MYFFPSCIGVCKYGYISVKAATNLFKMESGPFRNKKKMKLLQKELQSAMKNCRNFPDQIVILMRMDQVIIMLILLVMWFPLVMSK